MSEKTKSKSKFTPGPWVSNGGFIGTESPDGGDVYDSIANLHPADPVFSDDGGFDDFIHGPITEANGRLIAAAPNLYAELSHLTRLIEPLERDGTLNIPGLATLNGARAALALAAQPEAEDAN